uniref:Uncharacterized protein n=1 Tax=Acrobeloides nanus TaxID=290746 RepID=A0A914DDE6_9BILA
MAAARHSSAEDSTGMGIYETCSSSSDEENGDFESSTSSNDSTTDMIGGSHDCERCSSADGFINSYDEIRDANPELAPLKHRLVSVCTIGTGTFGRVELTRHKISGQYYALKAMYIPTIVAKRQVDHVHNEKKVLKKLNHPFIVKMYDTAKDTRSLYMILEFLAGGELFSYLRMSKQFPSSMVKFYAAEIILALEYLHSMYIAYRDLKPENLMLTHDGHIKLTDFGFAKEIHNKTYTICGTPEYLAPEVAERKGHSHAVDWWSLGILIFELMTGYPPFRGRHTDEVQQKIREQDGVVKFPRKTFSANAKDIVNNLLKRNPKERLGASGAEEVKCHAWLSSCDWDKILAKAILPPLIPTIYHEGDTGNFDSYEEMEKQPNAPQRELDLFDEW